MRSHLRLTLLLTLPASLLIVSGCGGQERIRPLYPSAADLAVEPDCDPARPELVPCKPVPTPEILTSAKASAAYDAAIEAWGERGWRAVGRICRQVESWEKGQQLPFDCPTPDGN